MSSPRWRTGSPVSFIHTMSVLSSKVPSPSGIEPRSRAKAAIRSECQRQSCAIRASSRWDTSCHSSECPISDSCQPGAWAAVLRVIREAREQRRRERDAAKAALSFFRDHYDEDPIPHMARVLHMEPGRVIVRVCFGTTRPPRRRWFAVVPEVQRVEELGRKEAKEFDRAVWR